MLHDRLSLRLIRNFAQLRRGFGLSWLENRGLQPHKNTEYVIRDAIVAVNAVYAAQFWPLNIGKAIQNWAENKCRFDLVLVGLLVFNTRPIEALSRLNPEPLGAAE